MKSLCLNLSMLHKPGWPLFAIPSLVGICFYLAPIYFQGAIATPVALLVTGLQAQFHDQLPAMITFVICFTAITPIIAQAVKPDLTIENKLLKCILQPSTPHFVVRQLGIVWVLIIFFDAGPEFLCHPATGSMILNNVLPAVFLSLMVGGLLLPLLLNFGLPEFCGALMSRLMRPVFGLPGHSAVTCMASWFGDNCVGVLIANQQYECGQYTLREAAVIGTTFSTVSITFSLVVITQVGLLHLFIPFYFTICLAGFVNAVIVPRLPPLAGKPNVFIGGEMQATFEPINIDQRLWTHAVEQAIRKTDKLTCLRKIFTDSIANVLIMVITVLPITATVATAALLLAQHTPLFNYLGKPLVPMLGLLQIPEAANASGCMLIGFSDMILPSVLAGGIQSELTRFFIATMSVVQLIYLSETGALLMASKIKVNAGELFIIFILRTLITMPVVALMAHIVV